MDFNTIPLQDTDALVQWLDTLYPEKSPDPKDSEREIWMKAGERRVINFLIHKINQNEGKVLKEK
jgi:hypothetical protein